MKDNQTKLNSVTPSQQLEAGKLLKYFIQTTHELTPKNKVFLYSLLNFLSYYSLFLYTNQENVKISYTLFKLNT